MSSECTRIIYARPHPYRFVFLDACETANNNGWSAAFGVLPTIIPFNLTDKPGWAQAFVGWQGKPRCPASDSEWDEYGDTLAFIFDQWMQGARLDDTLYNASQTGPYGNGQLILSFPLGEKFSLGKRVLNQVLLNGNVNNFHYVIKGYPGITRTGYN